MGFALPWVRRRRRKRPSGFEWIVLMVWLMNVRSGVVAILKDEPVWVATSLFFVVWFWNDRPYARGVKRILYEWIVGKPDE